MMSTMSGMITDQEDHMIRFLQLIVTIIIMFTVFQINEDVRAIRHGIAATLAVQEGIRDDLHKK